MPSLTFDYVQVAIQKYPIKQEFNTFIESGTFYGQTIFEMESHFKQLYTIELSKEIYQNCQTSYFKAKNEPDRKITMLHGESHIVFETLLPTINTPSIFFLDGHWSCYDTACGSKQVPLLEELQVIMEKFQGDAIIIIDDYRLFNGKDPVVDWTAITKEAVIATVKSRMLNYYYLNSILADQDRLIINIKSKI